MQAKTYRKWLAASASALAASLVIAGAASAQTATSAIRGTVTGGAGAQVVARNVDTGYTTRDTADESGSYTLLGLSPGSYEVTVTTSEGTTYTESLRVLVGQTANLDLGEPEVVDEGTEVEAVVVTARRPVIDVRTSEVSTNVTREQIDTLPQINRNFLNFAALAPGVRVAEDETERTISAGGQGAQAINVFIDGQNQKSTIIDGGVAGQDDSRGNPFPQGAVQEFRVISQNFKAEYEQAGSAIVTAVTSSGTNNLRGDLFVTYQNESWVEQDEFSKQRGEDKKKLDRRQYGGSIGGPIIQDRLHYFASYERKDETRNATIFLNRPEFAPLFGDQTGTFETPFEQDLAFGKISWNINEQQRLDLSGTYRKEADIRDAGGNNAFSRANEIASETSSVVLRHQFQGNGFLNEAAVDYFRYLYNPTALDFNTPGTEYILFRDDSPNAGFQYNFFNRQDTIFRGGGSENNQNIEQKNFTFRNDLTFTDLSWNGDHTLKFGVKYSRQNMYVNKQFTRNPQFIYDVEGRAEINGSTAIPVAVRVGSPTTPADIDNDVIGVYLQDDWQVNDRLELNLGIRWDYESNMVNNDYRTPDAVRNMLLAIQNLPNYDFPYYFNPSDYISDGDREARKDAFAPRVGFSYDVNDDERLVVFGGAGRYYDRIPFNFAFDERFKPEQFTREIQFSPGGVRPGTVAFLPQYLTASGLQPLLDATPAATEVFLLRNDAPLPYTDQFNLGLRTRTDNGWVLSATLAYNQTHNEQAWYIANPGSPTDNRFGGPTPASVGFTQFRNLVFFSTHDREREFKAIYLTADKPYTPASGWGFQVTYTLSKAEQNGSRDGGTSPFDFDYNFVDQTPTFPSENDERHRIVASGIVDLPLDFRLATLITLSSGKPYTVFDRPTADGRPDWNAGRPPQNDFIIPDAFAYRQVDLRLIKQFEVFNGDTFEIYLDAINIFNFVNYKNFDQGFNSSNFGRPTTQFLPTRSFQLGGRYVFD